MEILLILQSGCRGRFRMVVEFVTTYAISARCTRYNSMW